MHLTSLFRLFLAALLAFLPLCAVAAPLSPPEDGPEPGRLAKRLSIKDVDGCAIDSARAVRSQTKCNITDMKCLCNDFKVIEKWKGAMNSRCKPEARAHAIDVMQKVCAAERQ